MEEHNYVEEAIAILKAKGFPVERIRVLPAGAEAPALDRGAVLGEAREVMADGAARRAREIAALINKRGKIKVEKRDVNSVLSREGKSTFAYDPIAFTYRLSSGG